MLPQLASIIPQLLPDGMMRGCEYRPQAPERAAA